MFGLVTLVGAAGCSSAAVRAAPTTTAPTLPPPAAPSTTTAPPAPGSTDATPPPVIHATGSNYPAIAASLFRYRGWLLAHHPDPELADEAFARGTVTYEEAIERLGDLGAAHHTVVSLDQRLTFKVASVHGMLTTLLAHEIITEERVLDRHGHVVSATHFDAPNTYFVLMTSDYDGRWRLADVTDLHPDPTIPL